MTPLILYHFEMHTVSFEKANLILYNDGYLDYMKIEKNLLTKVYTIASRDITRESALTFWRLANEI